MTALACVTGAMAAWNRLREGLFLLSDGTKLAILLASGHNSQELQACHDETVIGETCRLLDRRQLTDVGMLEK